MYKTFGPHQRIKPAAPPIRTALPKDVHCLLQPLLAARVRVRMTVTDRG